MIKEFYDYYNRGREEKRYERCKVEFLRSKIIIEEYLKTNNQTILDMGGGAGYYSFWLSEQGHQVHLRDIVPLHIEQARDRNSSIEQKLSSIEVGNATKIDFPENYFDAVLLLGPLYHLQNKDDRIVTLQECKRVLKKSGQIFAVCIPRTASYIDGFSDDLFNDDLFLANVNNVITTGKHTDLRAGKFTDAYFHKPAEFIKEIEEVGLVVEKLLNIEGPFKVIKDFDLKFEDPKFRDFYLKMAKLIEEDDSLMGMASHLMAIIRKC